MKVKDFKMKVTDEQSIIVQKVLFDLGYFWIDRGNSVLSIPLKYLYFDSYGLSTGRNAIAFTNSCIEEITFDEFKELYMKAENFKISENWAVKRTRDNFKVLNDWANSHIGVSGTSAANGYIHSIDYGYSGHSGDGHYYADSELHPEHTLITFEQFIKYILNKKEGMELKVTKEKVLEAAEVSSEAKEVLKTLFPNVFDEIEFSGDIYIDDRIAIQNRTEGKFRNKSLWLNPYFNWKIIIDDYNMECLIPTERN